MIGRTLSHYRIVEKIGAGGMGEVYRAEDQHLGRSVALKVLPPGSLASSSARARFRKEALALAKLNHPHIETVHDFDTEEGVDFLVMEHILGTTLDEKLAAGPLPEKEILLLGSQIAEGLVAAHEKGIVHRDLKPANLRLAADGRLKILDFGLAKLLPAGAPGSEDLTASRTQGVAGTLPYMAPEQLLGKDVDGRCDIYACGVVLFELATGHRPFGQPVAAALSDAILHQAPPRPRALRPDLSARLEEIILKCLDKDPERRYQSARELLVDLRRAGAGASGPIPEAPSRKSRRPLAAIVLGVVAVAAAFLLWTAVHSRRRATGAGRIQSIVALPSKVLGAEADAFLTDAIPNTLSTELTHVAGLETRVPPTSIEFERIGGDLTKVADAYDVGALVLSSITAESDHIVLNLQLVEPRTRRLLWSSEFDGQRANYLGLVREAAHGLADVLREGAQPVASNRRATASSEAELAFQRALHYSNRYNNLHLPADFDLASAAFQQALKLDPGLAEAASQMALLYVFKSETGVAPAETLPEVQRWSRSALQIDSRNCLAQTLTGLTELFAPHPDMARALAANLKGAAFGPRSAQCQNGLGMTLNRTSVSLAVAAYREAYRLDPLYLYPPSNAAENLGFLGQTEEASRLLDEVLRLEPEMPTGLYCKGFLMLQEGRRAEATALLKRLGPLISAGRLPIETLAFLQDLLALDTGKERERDAALARLKQQAEGPTTSSDLDLYTLEVVRWLSRHGRNAEAVEILARRAGTSVAVPYDLLLLDRDLAPLRRDPRFQKALAPSRAQFDEMLTVFSQAQARGEFPSYLEKPLSELLARLGLGPGSQAGETPPRSEPRAPASTDHS